MYCKHIINNRYCKNYIYNKNLCHIHYEVDKPKKKLSFDLNRNKIYIVSRYIKNLPRKPWERL